MITAIKNFVNTVENGIYDDLFWVKNNILIHSAHDNIWGDTSGLSGDCSKVFGLADGVELDCTGLSGDLQQLKKQKNGK